MTTDCYYSMLLCSTVVVVACSDVLCLLAHSNNTRDSNRRVLGCTQETRALSPFSEYPTQQSRERQLSQLLATRTRTIRLQRSTQTKILYRLRLKRAKVKLQKRTTPRPPRSSRDLKTGQTQTLSAVLQR